MRFQPELSVIKVQQERIARDVRECRRSSDSFSPLFPASALAFFGALVLVSLVHMV